MFTLSSLVVIIDADVEDAAFADAIVVVADDDDDTNDLELTARGGVIFCIFSLLLYSKGDVGNAG